MTQDAFAGRHTEEKLEAIEKYLKAYTTALKKRSFKLIYFDAFAGTGEVPFQHKSLESFFKIEDEDIEKIVIGSADRALNYPFHAYYFVEKIEKKFNDLRNKYSSYAKEKNIQFLHGDANEHLKEFIRQFNPDTCRALIFLDPFGNQISMDTLELLASKPGLDIWYLFPAGLGVNRQISKTGHVVKEAEQSLDRIFGKYDWRSALLKEIPNPNLFDSDAKSKMRYPVKLQNL